MRYSIIIPHKDRLSLLEILLNSIPKKEYLEILVIDDASDEGIQVELGKLVENRANHRLIRNTGKKSKGAGCARNKGLENATGEYVLFADSDDYFSEKAFGFIEKEVDGSSSDLIVFMTNSVDEKGNKSARTAYYKYLLDRALSIPDPSVKKYY
ncbi:MAG: glycosyltransferase family 2 protein [Balneola sp.]